MRSFCSGQFQKGSSISKENPKKNSPGQRPNGVLGPPPQSLLFFFIDSSISLIIGRRPGDPDSGNWILCSWIHLPNGTFWPLRPQRVFFYRFWDVPKLHRKITFFLNFPKSSKVLFLVELVMPGDRFSIQKYDFWHPFWHPFFDFFQKWRKCEISEEYNAKLGSRPSKTFDFPIEISLNFRVFFRTSLQRSFWEGPSARFGSKVRLLSSLRIL